MTKAHWPSLLAQRAVKGMGVMALVAALLPGAAIAAPDPQAPPPAPAIAASGTAPSSGEAAPATAANVAYQLEIQAPRSLATLLRSYLDISRFQSAPQAEGITQDELQRLVLATPAQARLLLETEGHFNAKVTANVVRQTTGVPQVRIEVEPGPQTTVKAVLITAEGAVQTAVQRGEDPAVASLKELQDRWPMAPGDVFRQSDWASAKVTALGGLRAQGYPAAAWDRTTARVDAVNNTVNLELVVDSGPLFLMGPIQVEGLSRFDAESVQAMRTFSPGTPYSDKLILDYQERLRKLGLFETVAVEIDPDPATAAAAPVRVRVREQTLQQATTGIGFSDRAGPRVQLEHTHRRVFGKPWVAKNKFELGRDQQQWQGELLSYPLDNGYRNLVAGNLQREEAAGTLVRSSRLRAGRTLDTEALERLVFLEALSASTQTDINSDVRTPTINTSNRALSANVHWLRRAVDDVLLPTEGESANAQLGAGYALGGGPASNGPFTRAYGRLTAYRPVGRRWYATARVEAGQVFASDQVGIPDTLLFRAGGDDSVRGYGYRTLGPIEAGVVRSARVLLTGSLEFARPLSSRWPSVWGATFVDAGNAADHWNSLDPVLGYGVGVRWRSPVGPLRVDLAYGEAVRKARLHFSLGVSF